VIVRSTEPGQRRGRRFAPRRQPGAYPAVPVEPLAGKPVLDTINYISQRDGPIPGLYDGPLSSSEVLQRHLGSAHVVKVLNNITCWHLRWLARPAGATDRSALPIAGDDPIAKAAVTAFLDAIGYDSVDAGTLGRWPPLRVRQPRLRRTVRRAERRTRYPRRRGGTTRRFRRVRTGGHQRELEYGSSGGTGTDRPALLIQGRVGDDYSRG
jgi:hypothetical protein